MLVSTAEVDRADRVLACTIVKRDAIVTQMNCLHELAQKVERNLDILPLFRAWNKDIGTLVAQFHVEQDAIFDALIQLQRQEEFHKKHALIEISLLDQYYLITAVAEELCVNGTSSTTKTAEHDGSHIQLPKI